MNYLLKGILVFTLILGIGLGVQWNIVKSVDLQPFYSIWSVYIFHFLVAVSVFCAVFFVNKKQSMYTGYVFLAGTTLQMLACVLFLIPLVSASIEDKIPDVFSFMSPYFICLIAEVIFSVLLIDKKDDIK